MYICAWFDKKLNRFTIDDIGVDRKLIDLKSFISNSFNKSSDSLELTHHGCILNDDNKSLSEYDIKEDSEIHVIDKLPQEISPITYTDEELRKVSWELNELARVHNFHSIAHKVIKNRAASLIRETVINADNTAVAYLLHPELLLALRETETLKKIAKKHPSIIKATTILCEFIQAHIIQIQPTASSYYFPFNSSSGEEEEMDSNNESSRDSHSPRQNSVGNAITAAQLAAAIMNATSSLATEPPATSTPSTNTNVITNEMFNNALQQAFNNTPSVTPPVTPSTASDSPNFSGLVGRYENQLSHMRELGLTNDGVNIRALHATSGNLQEAVELVLNGVID